jgi:hypothetical protein
MTTTFRAAYWTDGQSDVLLTTEEDAALSDADLLAKAHAEADELGLQIGDGEIVIGDYRA